MSALFAGCPSQNNQVVPERPFLHRGLPRVYSTFVRAYVLIERLDGEKSRVLRDTTRMVQDERIPLTIDVFALFSSAVQFGEFSIDRGFDSFDDVMLNFCEIVRMVINAGESPYHVLWYSNRDIVARLYGDPMSAIRSFETIISFVWHPNFPLRLRFRIGSIFQQSLLILQLRQSNYDRMRREVVDPLVYIAFTLIWSRDSRNLINSAEQQLQHLYTAMIDIVREGIES